VGEVVGISVFSHSIATSEVRLLNSLYLYSFHEEITLIGGY